MLLSYAIVDFYLFYDGVVYMQILVLLGSCPLKVSDGQMTDKDNTNKLCGSLVLLT